ncbi:hypothetical protein NQ317_017748 [Molorchus minor]|uniref:ARID4A/B PWWP domain-containing protein n=1 Tax=Molorchus minor TaxID=1323400 RepID=A0ABQ9JUU9_9CUCU|nr:hypothetical protein NQ317_017748 [Molorchus minor]
MQVDDPPYLSVGTAVSAKYKGAFCEAKVSRVDRTVRCKVTYKMGLGNATLDDGQIKGTLRVGQLVLAKHADKKGVCRRYYNEDTRLQSVHRCPLFDDGDITTLRRTALCLKSGRHFNESETLDQLPLTHPEHFGNPVIGGRRGRRNRQLKEDSSDGEVEEENEPDLEGYVIDIGRVVWAESTDKKRGKDNWFPCLVVIPSAQPTVRINAKDEYLVRSFKDGRYYTVPKKEVTEFSREIGQKGESPILAEAVQRAVKFLDNNELPVHWERSLLFNSQSTESESDENFTDSSDDEPCEEKDRTLGVTMLNHTRSNKKDRGRTLIRDKDRSTPINSPRPDKEDEVSETAKPKKKLEEKKKTIVAEVSDTNSSDTPEQSEPVASTSRETTRPKRERVETKPVKEKKIKAATGEKVKALIEKFEEQSKKEEEEKVQQTRSKSTSKLKEATQENKTEVKLSKETKTPKPAKKPQEEDKKERSKTGSRCSWCRQYDEWIQPQRIAENLSATTKAKRMKQTANLSTTAKVTVGKIGTKRGRGMSVTGRTSVTEAPRSTTPSSVTSSSSRTKSPATPATRSTGRLARKGSETDASVSESELIGTRSGGKSEENELKTYRRKIAKPSTPKIEKRKDKEEEDTEKEEDCDKPFKRTRKIKKSPEKSTEESEDETNPPKGRDFDLNQIRSELKGFTKAIKVPSVETVEKEVVSSSDDSTNPPPPEKVLITEVEPEDKKRKLVGEMTKLGDDKNVKKRLVPRIFEDLDKSPRKRALKSPTNKSDKQESPISERKSFRRTPVRKPEMQDESDEEESMVTIVSPPPKEEDPFDKLVESPSFNLIKTELPETVDDYSRDMELSDCESQTQIFTRSEELFCNTFSKSSPDRNTLDMEFSSGKTDECKLKDSDDDDMIRAQIQRVIAQSSSTDEDSNDALMITPSTSSYQGKKRDLDTIPLASILGISTTSTVIEVPKVKEDIKEEPTSDPPLFKKQTAHFLNLSLSQPPVSLNVKLEETAKELSNVKTGTKIADSILQKFNSIKNKIEEEAIVLSPVEQKPKPVEVKMKPADNPKTAEIKCKAEVQGPKQKPSNVHRHHLNSRALLSLKNVGKWSDDDSQTDSLAKPHPDFKESDNSNLFAQMLTTDDSQSQEELKETEETEVKLENEDEMKEEDHHLHSLLLCEEEIPRSPAPVTETGDDEKQNKSVLEMPFASAPVQVIAKVYIPVDRESRTDAAAVLDNTPPTTPESTISTPSG